jgi:aspartate/methionine/tyrosine aminotransferase
VNPASRFDGIEISLIRQINALATPLTTNLGIGEPNLEPDETFREMAARAATEGSWQYTANQGTLPLRTHVAAKYGSAVDPRTDVCVTAGTQEALFAIVQAFVDPGDEVLIPDPGFLAYETVIRIAGGIPVTYPLAAPDWTLDTDELRKRKTAKTRAIIVNSPSNPTGAALNAEELDAIAGLGVLVISDEVYEEIHYGQRPPTMWGRAEDVLVVSGLSKSHGITGLRLGWVVGGAELIRPVVRAHQYIATCASAFSQQLAELIFENRSWNEDWLGRVRVQFREQRDAALAAAGQHLHAGIPAPAGAFYLFAPVPTCDTVGLAKALATEIAVLTIPGVAFGPSGEGFLRISYAARSEVLQTGIRRIGQYLEQIGR